MSINNNNQSLLARHITILARKDEQTDNMFKQQRRRGAGRQASEQDWQAEAANRHVCAVSRLRPRVTVNNLWEYKLII